MTREPAAPVETEAGRPEAPQTERPAVGPAAATVQVATTQRIELAQVATRPEHDLLGDRDVPAGAYWGVHTLRAVENVDLPDAPSVKPCFPELLLKNVILPDLDIAGPHPQPSDVRIRQRPFVVVMGDPHHRPFVPVKGRDRNNFQLGQFFQPS